MKKRFSIFLFCLMSFSVFSVGVKQENRKIVFDSGSDYSVTVAIPEEATVITGAESCLGDEYQYSGWKTNSESVRFLYKTESPFVFMKRTFTNLNKSETFFNRFKYETFSVVSSEDVKFHSFGTGGNMEDQKSYTFAALVKNGSNAGVVAGWLSAERGSGIIDTVVSGNNPSFIPELHYGRLKLEQGKSEDMELFCFGVFDDAREGLELYADLLAKKHNIKLKKQPTAYCTWYHAQASNQIAIKGITREAEKELKPYGFQVVQIDDGWQKGRMLNGPKKNFTDVSKVGPYSFGMKRTADYIKSQGLVPGIWFMPFAGTWNDPWFKDKQDFFVKKEDGQPYDSFWGGTSLDMSNPDARDYLADIVDRITNKWGFEYIKIDGLWTGLAAGIAYENYDYKEDNFGDARFKDENYTNIQAYRKGLQTVRDSSNENLFILGCNLSQNMRTLGASIGLVDAMRIGPDNGPDWDAMKKGPFSTSTMYFLNKRVWFNDPDPVYVRPSVPYKKARALVSWVGLTGSLHASSIDFRYLPQKRIELLQKNMPAHNLYSRPVDLFERKIANVWVTPVVGTERTAAGFFRWEDDSNSEYSYSLSELGLDSSGEYAGFNFWEKKFVPAFKDSFSIKVEEGDCSLISFVKLGSVPVVVGTDRHCASTSVDLLFEEWTGSSLKGESMVVSGDSYTVCIAIPSEYNGSFDSIKAVSAADGADVPAEIVENAEDHIIFKLNSTTSGRVSWSLNFK